MKLILRRINHEALLASRLPPSEELENIAAMKKRLAVTALVGIVNFFTVLLIFNFAHFHSASAAHAGSRPFAGFGYVYAGLMAIVNAGVIFAIMSTLKDSPDSTLGVSS